MTLCTSEWQVDVLDKPDGDRSAVMSTKNLDESPKCLLC